MEDYALHYYQFNISTYKSHTEHLDDLEDLAYRRMLDWCYLHERPLPKDKKDIARLIRMRTHSEPIANVLREFFIKDKDGNYINKRVFLEINKVSEKSSKARDSAKARWDKEKTDANALREACDSNATKDLRPKTKDLRPKNTSAFALPSEICPKAWADFEQHRKDIRKPLKPLSKIKSANILKELSVTEQQACVDKTISSGWAGLFPDSNKKSVTKGNNEVFARFLSEDKPIIDGEIDRG